MDDALKTGGAGDFNCEGSTVKKLASLLTAGRDGDLSRNFAGVIAMAGSRPVQLGCDVPALFESYALLEAALVAVGDTAHDMVVNGRAGTAPFILPRNVQTRILYREKYCQDKGVVGCPPTLALLKKISGGMLEYQAQWTIELARSLPLMQGGNRRIGLDITRSSGVLGLFYTEEIRADGFRYIMPDWYGAFWLDGVVEQCSVFPMLRSVFTQIPEDVDWVDAIAARIKDSGLLPTPLAWRDVC